jgi:hypothetical protein
MNWKRVWTRSNLIWFEIALALLLGLIAATEVLALPEDARTLAQPVGVYWMEPPFLAETLEGKSQLQSANLS